jgi:hypothetical protein
MAGPKISELYRYLTLPKAATRLGMHPAKLRRRIRDGIFPAPTFINRFGLKFFDEAWIGKATAIMKGSFEAKPK